MDGAKPKVLLVEDDPFMSTLLAGGFSREGFEVALATRGEDAVARFKSERPAVLLIDILLSGQSGLEALREIRALPGGADVPAIILSNLEETSYVQEAERLKVKAYLVKANLQVTEIVAKVKEVLGKQTR